jgi:hypothetical protein
LLSGERPATTQKLTRLATLQRKQAAGPATPCTFPRDISHRGVISTIAVEQLLSADSHTPNARNDRDGISRARQAAENLFKPARQSAGADQPNADPNAVLTAEDQPRRQPRIFTIPAQMPTSAAKSEMPAEPKPARSAATIGHQTDEIPGSQFGRVRALTRYGMSRVQVARLYGVGVDEIERIIKTPATSKRASAR